MEGNPLARKLRWPFIVASVGFCIVPYFSVEWGIVLSKAIISAIEVQLKRQAADDVTRRVLRIHLLNAQHRLQILELLGK
ncbi:MAG: hypothetical protein IH987_05285 [Planctomycetes bacterium]|nr:hypothetical protein [Planctomycetota bacterium]